VIYTNIRFLILVVSLIFCVAAQAGQASNQSATLHTPANGATQAPSQTTIPHLVKFSGTLLDGQEQPMAGPVGVTFALYSQQTGGAGLWMETQNVKPDEIGNYAILLGAMQTEGSPLELFGSGESRWLGVQAERQAEQPRVPEPALGVAPVELPACRALQAEPEARV
jgi:hypothetical protein